MLQIREVIDSKISYVMLSNGSRIAVVERYGAKSVVASTKKYAFITSVSYRLEDGSPIIYHISSPVTSRLDLEQRKIMLVGHLLSVSKEAGLFSPAEENTIQLYELNIGDIEEIVDRADEVVNLLNYYWSSNRVSDDFMF